MAKEKKKSKRYLKDTILFFYIFIYILIAGCEDVSYTCDECYLNVDAPSLITDNNGYYYMTNLDNYNQTFTTLRAVTGSVDEYQKLTWMANKEINLYNEWTNLVNNVSYTDDNGEGFTVLSIWPEFIGDTVTVYCGYTDQNEILYTDSLKVIIK